MYKCNMTICAISIIPKFSRAKHIYSSITLLPIKAEISSLVSPTVTNSKSPLIQSMLLSLFPLVDLPNKSA